MEIVCSNCQARLKIPDEKVPETGRVTAHCPKCKSKISFEKPGPGPEPPPVQEPTDLSSAIPEEDSEYGDDNPLSLDFYEMGAKLALLMVSEAEAESGIREAAERVHHKTALAKDPGDGINKMRFHHFDLVVLSEHFEGIPWVQSPVLHYMNRLPMHSRRRIFLVLLGSEFTTMDRMTAFAQSADLVVNSGDMDEFSGVLEVSLWNHHKFYGAFMETLNKLGKG